MSRPKQKANLDRRTYRRFFRHAINLATRLGLYDEIPSNERRFL